MKPDKEYNGRATFRMYNCDCMELINSGREWDLAIVDPPYGIGMDGYKTFPKSGNGSDWKPKEWDNNAPKESYWTELFKNTNNQIVWGANHYSNKLPNSRGWIVWNKHTNGKFSDAELAFSSFDKPIRVFDFTWDGFRQGYKGKKENRIHVTQKPEQLYKWLLTNYANEGDTILDTHGGSMSIAIACWDLGFDLDICELDEDYFNDAVKRFENHIAQKQLF